MSPFTFAVLLLLLGSLWWFIHLRRTSSPKGQKLPPGPRGLPIIGNLHMLGNLPHRSLRELAKKYGPIMSLRLGNVPTIVVSSPQAAELFLKTHDAVFASRPKVQATEYVSYGGKGIVFTEYGPYWRSMRKCCTQELLSTAKIDSFAGMRREELGLLVGFIKEVAAAGEVVDLTEKVAGLMEDVTCRMLFGRNNYDKFDMKGLIQDILDVAGTFNLADFVPLLGALDLQGLTRRLKTIHKAGDKFLEHIISEHEQDANAAQLRHDADFIHVMLSQQKNKSTHSHDELPYTIDRTNIKAIVLDMIAAAIDTSHGTIVWVMSELLRHQRVMKRLQDELEDVVGIDRMVEEMDLPKLDYLYMVVKEGFRLYPAGPLLGPHESMEDIEINGYYIPKKSRIIVNSWALGRDPNTWSKNAEEFFPERFIGKNIDLRGRDFQLIPFGSGRRGCPGIHLGLTNVLLVVAQLVHCFNWELPNGMSPDDLDMTEKFCITMPRAKHLYVVPTYRL